LALLCYVLRFSNIFQEGTRLSFNESNLLFFDRRQKHSSNNLLQNLWQRSLFSPWKEMDSRPKKEIRGRFIQLGYLLSGGDLQDTEALEKLAFLTKAIETLHLGSLIVDDIEGNNEERRSGPALHRKIGVPLALNVGNFLYFETFDQIRKGPFTEEQKLKMFEAMIETFCQAHRGQALDLSVRVDELAPKLVKEVCLKSLELKSGVLMSLSLRLGAMMAPNPACIEKVSAFGIQFGSVLQMIDDVGSLKIENRNSKNLEELILRRPTWIWTVLAENFSAIHWARFCKAVHLLPQTAELAHFLAETHLKEKAFSMACEELGKVLLKMKESFQLQDSSTAYQLAKELGERLTQAYQ
jgi:geranylgeranyl pyrophosphate synthase